MAWFHEEWILAVFFTVPWKRGKRLPATPMGVAMVSCYVLPVCPHGLLCDISIFNDFYRFCQVPFDTPTACNSQVFFILWGFANALLLGRDSKHRSVDTFVLKLEACTWRKDWFLKRASLEIIFKNAFSKSKVLWRNTTQRGWWIAFAKSLPGGTEHHCSKADFHSFYAKLCAWHSGKWAPWAAKIGLNALDRCNVQHDVAAQVLSLITYSTFA